MLSLQISGALIVSLAITMGAYAAPGPDQRELDKADGNTEWVLPNHDYSSHRYVPLREITPAKARELRPVCIYQAGDQNRFLTNPLVYGGTMYLTTGVSTIALDASTCRQRWRHDWKAKGAEAFPTSRGAAIKDGKVVRGTNDGYLIALDAATGKLVWERQVSSPEKSEQISVQPLIFEDLVVLGFGSGDFGAKGWIGAFRLSDGQPVWRFNTVPDAGAAGAETWGDPDTLTHGGGAVWTTPSLDAATGLLYVPVGNPAPFLFGKKRVGANLYTGALVVLDVRTGKLNWYKQFVPHDTHDWDMSIVGPLFAHPGGSAQHVSVTVAGKDGLLRVLDSETHEERFNVPIATRTNWESEPTEAGVRVCPGASGGALWGAPAFDPNSRTIFITSIDWCGTYKSDTSAEFVPGAFYFGGSYEPDPVEKSKGRLTSIDATSGKVNWKYDSDRPILSSVVATGGGVVFTGEITGDFIALDAKNGKVLYRFNTGGPVAAGLVSYAVKGKQYVATTSGVVSGYWQAPGGSATIVVFALP